METDLIVPERFSHLKSSLADPEASRDFANSRELIGKSWAAVLIAISNTDDPDIVFTERSTRLRNHPGQIAFPGGRQDPGDKGPAGTALREANEEVGLHPDSVHLLGKLPPFAVPVSQFDVVTVVGFWDGKQQLKPVDLGEVASVQRWTIAELSDPKNRVSSLHSSGHIGPAWQFGEYFLWGFSGLLVDHLLKLGGWEKPWDRDKIVKVPKRYRSDLPQLEDN